MMFRRLSFGERERERGATAILVAIVIVVLLGFAALVVDVGHLFQVRGELQNGADAAALAGAQRLDCTSDGITNAETAAREFAARHWADFYPLASTYDPEDLKVELGRWFFSTATETEPCTCAPPCFCPIPSPTSDDARVINAVRVTAFRSGTDPAGVNNPSRPVGHSFAMFIGKTQTDVLAQAVAVGAGPGQECAFPMVVPDCAVDPAISPDGVTCDYCMRFQDNNNDNAAWTSFDSNSVSPNVIADLIRAACYNAAGDVAVDETSLECQGTCHTASAGDEIKVNNGNMMNDGTNNFCPVIKNILQRGDPTAPAQPFSVRVPVLLSDDYDACDASQFSGSKIIAGFATMTIYGAGCTNNDPGVYFPTAPACWDTETHPWPPPSGKMIIAALHCGLQDVEGPGGGCFGVETTRSRLVQ